VAGSLKFAIIPNSQLLTRVFALLFVRNGSFWFSLEPTRSLFFTADFKVTSLEAEARGQPPRMRARRATGTHELRDRLRNLCMARKEGRKSVAMPSVESATPFA